MAPRINQFLDLLNSNILGPLLADLIVKEILYY